MARNNHEIVVAKTAGSSKWSDLAIDSSSRVFAFSVACLVVFSSCAAEIRRDETAFKPVGKQALFGRFVFQNDRKEEIPLVLFEPKPKKGEKFPLMLYLHTGGGMGGPENGKQLGGAALRIVDAQQQTKHPCFIVSPRADNNHWCGGAGVMAKQTVPESPSDSLRLALELVDELLKRYPIDPKRVYVSGHGIGACGALAAVSHRPNFFAGVIVEKAGMYQNSAKLLLATPIAFVLDPKADELPRDQALIKDLKDAGHSTLETFETTERFGTSATYEWMFRQRRAASAEPTKQNDKGKPPKP